MTRHWLGSTLVLAGVLLAAPVGAEEAASEEGEQEISAEEAATRQEAQAQFFLGMERVQQERWEEALAAFARSLELYPTQAALFNRGSCLGLMGRPVQAVETLEQHLEQYGATISEEQRATVQRALDNNRGRIAHIEVTVEEHDGATLALDGAHIGESPLTEAVAVNPGRHQVTADLEGYIQASEWVEVAVSQTASVTLTLEEVPPPEQIVTEVEAENPGFGLRLAGWITMGVGVALVGTSVALIATNGGRYDDWETENSALHLAYSQTESEPQDSATLADRVGDNNDLASRIETMDAIANALLGVGAAAAAAGVVLVILGYRARSQAEESDAPEVSIVPTLNGLALNGRW